MEKEIKKTLFFTQPPQEVWEYLTKPELIELWLGKTDFQLIAGCKFHFTDKLGKIIYCEVLEIKPFTKLSYSWQKNSAKDNKSFNSKVVWTLVAKENGTELQLVHNGFTALEDFTAHENGWNTCLKRLEELINTI